MAKSINEKKAKLINNGHSQKIVSTSKIRQGIEHGREFVQLINSREAVPKITKRAYDQGLCEQRQLRLTNVKTASESCCEC